MRHVMLTCKNHPELRWSCKSIAFTPGFGYNGSRNIFFQGKLEEGKIHYESHAAECKCSSRDLILAPEETWDEECKETAKGFF